MNILLNMCDFRCSTLDLMVVSRRITHKSTQLTATSLVSQHVHVQCWATPHYIFCY